MKKLSEIEIKHILSSEERAALDYQGEIAEKRAKLMDYYNCQPYGDEVEGQSKACSSDVSDVVETLMPGLMRIFTQGRIIGQFESDRIEADKEARDKTELSNHVFLKENNGFMTLYNMFKDGLLQYTGTVKVYWDTEETSFSTQYNGLSEAELTKLKLESDSIDDIEEVEQDGQIVFNAKGVKITRKGRIAYDNVPPEEFLISKQARDFKRPVFIGHRTPKRRSELLQMGFDKDKVQSLPADNSYYQDSEQKAARYHDYDGYSSSNPTNHHPNDEIYLGDYYIELDVNGDGITEYYQCLYAGEELLQMNQVEDHPFAVAVPIPIPHRAIGTCPAEQVADIQYRKSHLVRNMLDNVYQTNYPRVMHSNKVDLDDLLTPRAGGAIEIDTDAPDVGGHAQPLVIPNMIGDILQSIEYTDTERETRTGVTRFSQGLNPEALNKTATGFLGLMDASQQREYLIARAFAEGGVKAIFEKTVKLLAKHQDSSVQIIATGEVLDIDPKEWGDNCRCTINVGLGSGDRQEKIANLNNMLMTQLDFMDRGLLLADQGNVYQTLEKIIDELGLKDIQGYFNNPAQPAELLQAQNEQLMAMVQELQAVAQANPLAEAEMIKAEAKLIEAENKGQLEGQKFILQMAQKDEEFRAKMQIEMAKLAQQGDKLAADTAYKLTELEVNSGQDVPGALV